MKPPETPLTLKFCRAAFGLAAATLVLLASTPRASGQSYSIDWHKIGGGGGTSSNSQFSISGTIGQADAGGPLGGGAYSISGGFWAIYAVQTAGAPVLHIARTATNTVVVSWPSPSTGFSLHVSTNLTSWGVPSETVNNDGTVKSIVVNPPAG